MSKKRTVAGQRSLSQARATRRPVAAPNRVAPPAKKGRFSLSPTMARWLRTSKIPIIIAAVVLVAILVVMFSRLTEAPPAAALPAAEYASTLISLLFSV